MYDKCDCFSNTATTSRVTCVCAISETYCHRRPRVPASNDVGRIFRDLFTVLLVILDPKPGFQCVKTSDELRTGKTATRLIKPYLMEDHSNSSPKSAIFHYIPTINLSIYIYPMKNHCWSTSNIIPICLGQVTIISPWKIPSHCLLTQHWFRDDVPIKEPPLIDGFPCFPRKTSIYTWFSHSNLHFYVFL